jgi:hypothetical protein
MISLIVKQKWEDYDMIMKKKVTPSVILLFLLLLVFTALIGCGSSWDAPVVADVSVTGVTLNKTSTSIPVGSTEQLTATIAPANATNQNVTWSTSDAGKATVSLSGLVKAVAAGTATITVTTVDGGFTATCTVTVPKWYVDPLGTDNGSHGTTTGAGAFKTIQYAINDSRVVADDIIKVAAGTYTENLTIDRSLSLIGVGDTTIVNGAVEATGDNVVVQNLKITNQNSDYDNPTHSYGVKATAGKALTLENVTVDVLYYGVRMEDGSPAIGTAITLNNSRIKGFAAIYLESAGATNWTAPLVLDRSG